MDITAFKATSLVVGDDLDTLYNKLEETEHSPQHGDLLAAIEFVDDAVEIIELLLKGEREKAEKILSEY